jgi:hypothetical protein
MKLTAENYYSQEANLAYMSVSQYKDFLKCEAAALAKLNGEYEEPKQDCFLLGSYVHAALEGTLEQFKADNPEVFSSRGATKGELKSEYRHGDVMIQTLRDDELCSMMLQGMNEQIITAELYGVQWKAKIDILAPEEGRIVDLKTVKSIRERYWNAEKGRYESFVECYGYTLQMAVYSELERLCSRRFERLEPFIVAVSKEDVPDKAVICFDEHTMETELQTLREKLPRVVAVKAGKEEPKRCEKCRYCRSTKKAQIIHFMSLVEAI